MNEERLTALEIKCAHLEDFVNKLQSIAVEQGNELDSLKAENTAMRRKITELSDTQEGDIPHIKPPHY